MRRGAIDGIKISIRPLIHIVLISVRLDIVYDSRGNCTWPSHWPQIEFCRRQGIRPCYLAVFRYSSRSTDNIRCALTLVCVTRLVRRSTGINAHFIHGITRRSRHVAPIVMSATFRGDYDQTYCKNALRAFIFLDFVSLSSTFNL